MPDLEVVDWPTAPIETQRLVVRPTEARDRAAFLDLLSDERVQRYLGGPRDRRELEEQVGEVPSERPGSFAVEHDGRFVGWVFLNRRDPDRPGRRAGSVAEGDLEVGYELQREVWGRGFATEAVGAVLAWAAERFDEPVVLCTQSANTASVALGERLGFVEAERFEEFDAEQWFGVRWP